MQGSNRKSGLEETSGRHLPISGAERHQNCTGDKCRADAQAESWVISTLALDNVRSTIGTPPL